MRILPPEPSRKDTPRTWMLAVAGVASGLLGGGAWGGLVIYCVCAPAGSYRPPLVCVFLGAIILLPALLGKWLTIPDPVRRTSAGSVVIGMAIGVSLAQNAPFARPELRIHPLPLIAVAAIGVALLAYGVAVLLRENARPDVTVPRQAG